MQQSRVPPEKTPSTPAAESHSSSSGLETADVSEFAQPPAHWGNPIPIQAKGSGQDFLENANSSDPGIASPGAGRPLADELRETMESSFQTDFSNVRVHQDHRADAMGAGAYARGENLHFSPGAYNPGSTDGRRLLGHELAHVVQQRQGMVPSPSGESPMNMDRSLEHAADVQGDKAARGERVGTGDGVTGAADAGGPVQGMLRTGYGFAPASQISSIAGFGLPLTAQRHILTKAQHQALLKTPYAKSVLQGPKTEATAAMTLDQRTGKFEMPFVGKGEPKTNAAGFLRDKNFFWKNILNDEPGSLSEANKKRIREGSAPLVDKTWIAAHPEHKASSGKTLVHHHIDQQGPAVGIPDSVHRKHHKELHPH